MPGAERGREARGIAGERAIDIAERAMDPVEEIVAVVRGREEIESVDIEGHGGEGPAL